MSHQRLTASPFRRYGRTSLVWQTLSNVFQLEVCAQQSKFHRTAEIFEHYESCTSAISQEEEDFTIWLCIVETRDEVARATFRYFDICLDYSLSLSLAPWVVRNSTEWRNFLHFLNPFILGRSAIVVGTTKALGFPLCRRLVTLQCKSRERYYVIRLYLRERVWRCKGFGVVLEAPLSLQRVTFMNVTFLSLLSKRVSAAQLTPILGEWLNVAARLLCVIFYWELLVVLLNPFFVRFFLSFYLLSRSILFIRMLFSVARSNYNIFFRYWH